MSCECKEFKPSFFNLVYEIVLYLKVDIILIANKSAVYCTISLTIGFNYKGRVGV